MIATEKLTKGEKITDFIAWFVSPLTNIIPIAKSFDNVDNEFYLVNDGQKQYLVKITSEFMESRELSTRITEKKFEMGNYKFICGTIVKA